MDRIQFSLIACVALLAFELPCPNVGAQQSDPASVTDRSLTVGSLTLISDEFEMADGAMFDGNALIVPDVKGQRLYRYQPRQDKLTEIKGVSGRFSASFYNHRRHYLADNPGGRIVLLDGNQVVPVASFDQWNQSTDRDDKRRPFRPNDLVVDNVGGIYVTFTPQGKVLYIDKHGKQSVAVDKIDTPNGIILSPDQSTLYVSSFVPKKVYAYPIVQPGQTGEGKLFASMDESDQRGADGMTVDRAGNVYCAGPDGIWIWDPNGKLIEKVACPTKPINCTFGDGAQQRTLYITGPGGLYRQEMQISGVTSQVGVVQTKPIPQRKAPDQQPSVELGDYDIAKFELDQVYATFGSRKVLADIFVPSTNGSRAPAIVVVHGGGWQNGDKKKFRALALALCQRGYVTMAIEYRLAGEAAFPAAMHDCSAAVRFLRANAEKYHLDPDRIGAVGGSAGGHLVGLMASGSENPQLHGEGGNPDQSSKIKAAIVLAGPLQISSGSVAERSLDMETPSNSRVWMRGTVDEKRALYELADAFLQIDQKTCPILFQVGEHDNPSRNQPSREKLQSLGIDTDLKTYQDGKHGCWNRIPWFEPMVADMDRFLRKHLK